MDPEGSIYLISNFLISVVFSLYIAVQIKEAEDDSDIGLSLSMISGVLVIMLNIYVFCEYSLSFLSLNASLIVGALFILIGHFIPFSTALAKSENLTPIITVFKPLISILNYTISFIISLIIKTVFKIFNLSLKNTVTEKDVLELVDDADEEVIDNEQKEMIENIFELNTLTAQDVMTHRTEVFALKADLTCGEVIKSTIEEGYSRVPVYEDRIDTIVGVLYAKDLLAAMYDENMLSQPISTIMRKAMFIPESCAANELLLQLKISRMQMAIVVDEYGGTSGIVTMEDVLEEIVGNIQDEYDKDKKMYYPQEDGSVIFLASIYLEDVFEFFNIELSDEFQDSLESEEFETLGGLIIDSLERIPAQDEDVEVEYHGLTFKVLEVADRRIETVLARLSKPVENTVVDN